MRKIISLILCLVMLVAVFAACNKTEAPADTDTESKAPADTDTEDAGDTAEGTPVGNGTLVLGSDPVEITYWYPVNDVDDEAEMENQAWDEIIELFQAKYPNVTVTLEGVGSDASENTAVWNTAAASNNLPELVYTVDGYIDNWGTAGVIMEYTDYLSDDYYAGYQPTAVSTANAFQGEGEVWISPCCQEVEGWVINAQILADNNCEVPNTIDELIEVVGVLNGNGILPIAHGGSDTWAIWGYHEFVNQYGWTEEQCIAFETGEMAVEDTAFFPAFEKIAAIAAAGAFADDVATVKNDNAGALWLTEQAAMWQIYDGWRHSKMKEYDSDPEAYADYYNALQNSVFKLGLEAPDDAFEDGEVHGIKMNNWGVLMGACAAEDEQKLAACIAFIEFFVSEECADLWAEMSFSIPLTWESDKAYDYSMWGLEQSYEESYALEGTFFHEPTDWFTISITDTYRNVVTGLICGSMTVEQACDEFTVWQGTAAAQLAAE